MREIRRLVEKARDDGSGLVERQEAFGELVICFQDMAFACAYSVLGDFYLAEDAAQEAFVTAWQSLDQLRTAEAFPGWLRRIVLTRCSRLKRGKHLQIVPLEAGERAPSPEPNPHAAAEQRQLRQRVMLALKALPEKERLVTTLFYVNGYTQADIGAFLQLPLTTVNKRLYSARQHLKESVVEMFRQNLRRKRPSRDPSFADKVRARLRPFSEGDWLPVSAIAARAGTSDSEAEQLWLRTRKEFNEQHYVRRHYVAEHAETGQLLGYGSIEQTIYLPRYRLILVTDPLWLRRGVGELLLSRLVNDLHEVGAVTATFRDYESRDEMQSFLKEHGFAETMRLLDLRLAVSEAELSSFSPIVEKVKALGITISTLSEERARDPLYVEKLYELTTALRLDDPARDFFTPPAYYEREVRLWLEKAYVLPDAYFIAREGDRYVGVTDLNLLEAMPGGVSQGFTGVRREYRRKGIATALKACAVEYARERGFKTIRALLRPVHSSLLALNEKLGFKHLASYVTLERCLKEVVRLEPSVLDEYAGEYRDDERRPELTYVVRNEGGRLTAEFAGQKVELFPESETRFFVKYFYGEINFIRDEEGKVCGLGSRTRGLNRPETLLQAKKIKAI
ncbi:MAG TPA: GNAT family N-acetyltransferase [Pyrinomonadaceae bacterium]